ncbi:uncharacterized protein LOC144625290 isoform X3 [Crassostrea virginica]
MFIHCIAAMHWILSNEPECEEMPALLVEDLLTSEEYLHAQCKLSYLREKLTISPEKIIQTAWLTRGQRENSVWAAVRKLRITASNFGQVIGAIRRNRLTVSLKKRLLSAYNLEKRPSIQWGLTHEKSAIDCYCKTSEITVLQTGIWLHESGVLGASPDGFVQGVPRNIKVHIQGKVNASPDIIESVNLRTLYISKRPMIIGIKFKASFTSQALHVVISWFGHQLIWK